MIPTGCRQLLEPASQGGNVFLAWRDLLFAKGRFVLVGVVIALIALLTTLLSGLANGLVDDGISGLRGLPLTHLAFQPGAKDSFTRSSLDESNLKPWQDLKGAEASALGVSFFNARTPSNSTIDLALFGVPAGSFLAPEGEARDSLAGTPGIVLSDEFKDEGLKVGDKLTIVGPDLVLPILGFTYTGSYGHVEIAFTSLTEWQQLLYGNDARGRFSAVAIKAPDSTDFATIDHAADTETSTKIAAYSGSPGFSEEQGTMSLIRVFLLAISALIVGAFFTVWTVQRTRQIGLMKALGASNMYILRDALGQLAVILVVSTAVGALLATLAGQFVGPKAPFSLQAGPVITSSVILIVLGMIGSLVAIRRVTSVDPIIAMGAE